MSAIYSEIADFYHELFPVNTDLIDYLTAALKPGSSILDIGCGCGHISGILAKQGFSVLGTDINQEMISRAVAQWPAAQFRVLDMNQIDRIAESFDCMLCVGNVISYLNSHERKRFVRIVHSMLNTGGYWISQMVNWDAILKKESHLFPEKNLPERDVLFRRQYRSITAQSVQFVKEISVNSHSVTETDRLYPVKVNDYQRIHTDAGFKLTGHWRNFDGSPYDPGAPTGNVFIWQR